MLMYVYFLNLIDSNTVKIDAEVRRYFDSVDFHKEILVVSDDKLGVNLLYLVYRFQIGVKMANESNAINTCCIWTFRIMQTITSNSTSLT